MNLFAFKNNNLKANEVSSQAFSQYNDVLTERYNQILKLLEDEKISPEFAKLLTNYITRKYIKNDISKYISCLEVKESKKGKNRLVYLNYESNKVNYV